MAKVINKRKDSLTTDAGWNAQHLAMMANGLSKAEGADVQQALGHMAKAINKRKNSLTIDAGWNAQTLAVLANGLSKAEGADVQQALGNLAKAINKRKDSLTIDAGWNAQHLAMMANGLSKAEGADVQQALGHMAKAINKRKDSLTINAGWKAQHLAMMANGLCKASGPDDIRTALIHIEKAVSALDLTKGKGPGVQTLGMMVSSIGRYCAPELLKKLACALAKEAKKAPGALVDVLGNMSSRFSLSERHLDAADQLVAALMKHGSVPDDQRAKDEMLWNATLLHFAEQQQKVPDQRRALSFAQAYQHCLSSRPRIQDKAYKTELADDLWHIRWSADYWKKDILPATDAMDTRNSGEPDIPHLQKTVLDLLKKALPGHHLQMEVPIRDFSVDIMIDGRICVEVDGYDHFVDMRAEGGAAGQFAQKRRTKDQFIDHMLARYGYQVCRISDAHKPERLAGFVSQICSAVDTAPDSPMKSQGLKTVARQEEVDDQDFQPVQRRRRHKKAPAAAVR